MMQGSMNKAPSLVDLCVVVAINNIRYLGDVGETDLHLLDRILPHCNLDQLLHVEDSTVDRDLSPVTDKLWKKFYEKNFGDRHTNEVVEKMGQHNVSFRWRELYEAKLKDVERKEKEAVARMKQRYQKEDDRKQSRQIRICTKVPPSSNKRSFYGGSGPGYNVSNGKSNLMKKAKVDFLKSQEVKNITAMKRNALQRNKSTSSMIRPSSFRGHKSTSSANVPILPPRQITSSAGGSSGFRGNNSAPSSNIRALSSLTIESLVCGTGPRAKEKAHANTLPLPTSPKHSQHRQKEPSRCTTKSLGSTPSARAPSVKGGQGKAQNLKPQS